MAVSSYSYMPTSGSQHLYGAPQAANNGYDSNRSDNIFDKFNQPVDNTPAASMDPKSFIKGKKVNQAAVDKCVNEANSSKSEASGAKNEAANVQDSANAKKTPEEKAITNARKDLGKVSKEFGKLGKMLPPDIAGEFGETNLMFGKTTQTFLKLAIETRKKFVKLEKEGLKLINKGIALLKAGQKTIKAGEIITNTGFALEVASWVMYGVALGLMSNPFTLPAGVALKAASAVTGKIAMGLTVAGLALIGAGFIMVKDGEKKVKKGEKKLKESAKEKKNFNKFMGNLQKVTFLAVNMVNIIKGMIMNNLSSLSRSGMAPGGLATSSSNPFGGGMPQGMAIQGSMSPMGLQDAFSFDASESMGPEGQGSVGKSSSQDDKLLAAGAATLNQNQKGEIRKMLKAFNKCMKKMMDELKKMKQIKRPASTPSQAA